MVPNDALADNPATTRSNSTTIRKFLVSSIWVSLCLFVAGTVSSTAEPDKFRAVVENASGGLAEQSIRTIEVDMGDGSFDVSSIAVEVGETVRFVLRNTGAVPHEFAIGSPEKQRIRRGYIGRMITHATTEITPADREKLESWNAVVVLPGETRELTWTFDEVEGVEFACNAAGHYDAGMKGQFVPPSVADGGHDHSAGGEHADAHSHLHTGSIAAQPEKGVDDTPAEPPVRTVEIDMGATSFGVPSISVAAGETVRFVLRNTSPVAHDFTIGSPEKQSIRRRYIERMSSSAALPATPAERKKLDSWNAIVVLPGETRELEWTFGEAQDVEFACNASGHYQMGMKGRFVPHSSARSGIVHPAAARYAGVNAGQSQGGEGLEPETVIHASLPHHIRLSAIRDRSRETEASTAQGRRPGTARSARRSKHGGKVRTNFNGRSNRGSYVGTSDVGAVDRGGKPRRPDLRPSILAVGSAAQPNSSTGRSGIDGPGRGDRDPVR